MNPTETPTPQEKPETDPRAGLGPSFKLDPEELERVFAEVRELIREGHVRPNPVDRERVPRPPTPDR